LIFIAGLSSLRLQLFSPTISCPDCGWNINEGFGYCAGALN